ncbi:protein crooked neck-like [Vespa mandarinia]|uniref:protein crooked neck-like n=1 Tax=Vespa mandarinia TaxID=7446 RepID=UPI00161B884A|nr:protein crooked neck-like [Vespa mandarinia]
MAMLWIFRNATKKFDCSEKNISMVLDVYPKDKLFRGYNDLEVQSRKFDRCRILYEKLFEFALQNCTILDMPELLWKSYIDFEISQDEIENTRQLFERLLERNVYVKVSVISWYNYIYVKKVHFLQVDLPHVL